MTNETSTLAAGMVVGLLLASGLGRRFDADGRRNKLLARLPDGQTLICASARTLCNALEHVAVVVPTRGALIEAALSDLPVRLIRNARAVEGMGASIAVGVAALEAEFPRARGWLIALGDMPFILPRTIRSIADAVGRKSTARIVVPTYDGRRGHPVGFDHALTGALMDLQGDIGASVLMKSEPVTSIACDDGGVIQDIDTRDDLTRAPPNAADEALRRARSAST